MSDSPDPRFVTNAFWRMLPAGMRKRWWLFRLFDLLVRFWPVLKRRRGLVVVRMDGIGDMVLFRNSLDAYSEAFGVDASDITVIGCNSWAGIADQLFDGYRVIPINEHAYAKRVFYRFSINLKVHALAPEVVVCDAYFRRALMADSLVWVMAPTRALVSYPYINEPTRSEYTYYMSQVAEVVDTGPYPTHEIIRHANFVSHFTDEAVTPKAPTLNWSGKEVRGFETGSYVILNPGSNEFGRRWPLESYIALASWLAEQGHRVLFVGKADEKAKGGGIGDVADGEQIVDLTGKTNMPELLNLMKNAALVVSNDTGPAHLAIGLGAPTVVIVGGGHFGSFVPYPDEITPENVRFVFQKMDCYHCFWRCHKRDDRFASFPCVAAVTNEQVRNACEAVLPS